MGDEIDDFEFARQMLSLQVNKYEENRNRGMKQKQVVEKSHNIIPLSDFEEKIIFNILLKIPPRYIHKNAMPVCKTWKEIFSRTSFIEQNFNELKSELLIQSGYVRHMKTKLIEIGKDLECKSRDLGLNKTRKIHSSCDGLMSEPDDFYFGKLRVINPATKFCITIPGCPSRCQHGTCSAALVFDSSTEQYKVVHIVNYCFGFEIFNLSNAEENWKWERVDSDLWEGVNNQPFAVNFCWKNLVSINGRILHWYVNSSEYFVSMDVKEGKFSRTYLPERDEVVNKTNNYALIQLDGFLSYITCDSETTMDVWILEDFHGQVWSKKHMIVAELTHYVCPSKSTRPNERSMPEIGKLVAVGGARNGEVLILKQQKNSKQYLYDTKSRVMKMFNICNMRNSESFVTHKESLFSMKRIS